MKVGWERRRQEKNFFHYPCKNCREFDTLIHDFLDGAIDPALRLEADAHRESMMPGTQAIMDGKRSVP